MWAISNTYTRTHDGIIVTFYAHESIFGSGREGLIWQSENIATK